jgi:hypothetical protein
MHGGILREARQTFHPEPYSAKDLAESHPVADSARCFASTLSKTSEVPHHRFIFPISFP